MLKGTKAKKAAKGTQAMKIMRGMRATKTMQLDMKTLSGKDVATHCNIQKECTMHLVLRLSGAMRIVMKTFTGKPMDIIVFF